LASRLAPLPGGWRLTWRCGRALQRRTALVAMSKLVVVVSAGCLLYALCGILAGW
jgi:hypothetical protein